MADATYIFFFLGFLLLASFCQIGETVDTPVVEMKGGSPTEDYLRANVGMRYEASCTYRHGYNDDVKAVSWLLYGREVYRWSAATDTITVNAPLRGHVDPSPGRELHHLHIRNPQLNIAGEYACRVESTMGVATSDSLQIHVIDISPGEFSIQVDILSDILEENGTVTEESEELTALENPWLPAPPFSLEPSCMLVWSFLAPAIAPKPNVTCGFYFHAYDDITEKLPGGLMLHQRQTGAWQAQIENTNVPVASIPINSRLGCSVAIPHTSYREIIKFEDGLAVDNIIDTAGCPLLDQLPTAYGLQFRMEGASPTCRGDVQATTSAEPVLLTISCPSTAVHPGGEETLGWNMVLSCSRGDSVWRTVEERQAAYQLLGSSMAEDPLLIPRADDPMMSNDRTNAFDPQTFLWPQCVGGATNGAISVSSPCLYMLPYVAIVMILNIGL